MGLFKELNDKGLIVQTNNIKELEKALDEKKTIYLGIDPTHNSLHVGHLFAILIALKIAQNGNKVIFIMGTGTTRIGDPSGKNEIRKMLGFQEIEENKEHIKKQIQHISKNLKIKSENTIFLDNNDWLSKLNYMDFLRDFGIHFSVNRMLKFETFKTRLEAGEDKEKNEAGLNFIELNYNLLQSYDFYHLFVKYDCAIQIGGNDQWANIISGIELIRKKENKEALCMTIPLIETSDGKKMGKTEKGAVFLDKDLVSVYDFFQYWRNTQDKDVLKFLSYFTRLDQKEIEKLSKEKNINELKEILAFEVGSIVHSKEEAQTALDAARAVFSGEGELENIPKTILEKKELELGINVIDLFVRAKLCKSKGEAKRLLKQGGLYINKEKIQDENISIDNSFLSNNKILLRSGKKNYHLIESK